jgi:hypothetical protein
MNKSLQGFALLTDENFNRILRPEGFRKRIVSTGNFAFRQLQMAFDGASMKGTVLIKYVLSGLPLEIAPGSSLAGGIEHFS